MPHSFHISVFWFFSIFFQDCSGHLRIWSTAKWPFTVDETGWIGLYIAVLSAYQRGI